jgi:hypothetical protein
MHQEKSGNPDAKVKIKYTLKKILVLKGSGGLVCFAVKANSNLGKFFLKKLIVHKRCFSLAQKLCKIS